MDEKGAHAKGVQAYAHPHAWVTGHSLSAE